MMRYRCEEHPSRWRHEGATRMNSDDHSADRGRDFYGIPARLVPAEERFSHRRMANIPLGQRHRLLIDRAETIDRLRELDATLEALSAERRAILDSLDALRERLWPVDPSMKGRRPPAHDERVIAPAAFDDRPLSGRRLRSTCLAILRRHGAQRLRDLHDLLHRYGYSVSGPQPVKTLADAMGYERDSGRAIRVRRGVYDVDRRPRRGGSRSMPLPRLMPPGATPGIAGEPSPDPDLVDDLDGRVVPSRSPEPPVSASVPGPFTLSSPATGRRATRPPYGASRYPREQSVRPRRAPVEPEQESPHVACRPTRDRHTPRRSMWR